MAAFQYSLRPPRFITVEDYRQAARRKLPRMIWEFVDGGAEDGATVQANRAAFGRWSLRTAALAGHSKHEIGTSVAGLPLSLPVMLAPTGLTGMSHWTGDIAALRAAEAAGTSYCVSSGASYTIEEIAEVARGEHFFQLYPSEGDLAGLLMQRAWNHGFRRLMVTVDVPVMGNREGERRYGMGIPPVLTPTRLVDVSLHPAWTYNLLRKQRVPARNIMGDARLRTAAESVAGQARQMMQSTLSWDDLEWIRDQWRGPVFVKGLLNPDDARRAVSIGIDGVIVSNHGGRQLDFAPATLDVLPAIVDAVGSEAEILLDGGVRRGTDVVKALALGARAVLIGRPYVYALAARGETGIAGVLDIFRAEIDRALTLMGVSSVHDLDRSWLIRTEETVDAGVTAAGRVDGDVV